ncbi:MAG: YceK/YidQ family lipoprotein [Spartobacteria bacterium]|nr:YceK/YidQ family lipoprotein [Spartobacteria bacterium]
MIKWRIGFIGVLLTMPILVTGCATVIVRSSPHEIAPGPYPATRFDLAFTKEYVSRDTRNAWTGDSVRFRDRAGVLTLCVLDIPFSLVTDTVLLPVDLFTWDRPYPPQESRQ